MKYVSDIFTSTFEIKQSKFIAYLIPYTKYEKQLQTLKKEHPKARHFVVAYRYLNEFNQIVEYSSDDGEPKGTSGKPSLMVLQGADIINTAVIIVRYFGGTKLGTGGLVRAYSDAVNLVLESARLFTYVEKIQKTIEIAYTDIRFIEYEASLFDVEIVEKRFENMCTYTIEATRNNVELFLSKVKRLIRLLA